MARPSSSMRDLHPIEEAARRFCSGASGDTEHPGARINAFPPVMVFRAGRQFPLSGCRLDSPGSRRLGGEVHICLGEVQYCRCLSIIFDLRHKRSDLLGDRLPSPRSYPRCLCLRVCPSCHRHDPPGYDPTPCISGSAGPGRPRYEMGRDKWPAPTCARGRASPGRRPLPDPVPVKAELRLLARETLDPGEVGPSEPSTRTAWLPPRGVLTGG